MPLPLSFAQASAAVGEAPSKIAKKLEAVPGRCATLNELHDWWVKELNGELRDLKNAVEFMLKNGFATAKTLGHTKMLTLSDLSKPAQPAAEPPPKPAAAAPTASPPTQPPAKPPAAQPAQPPAKPPEAQAAPGAADDWCGADEAARLLGVGKNHLSYYARNNAVAVRNVGRGAKIARYLYSRKSIMALAEQNKNSKKFAAAKANGAKNGTGQAGAGAPPAAPEAQSDYKTDLDGGLELRFYLSRGQHEVLSRLTETGMFDSTKTGTAKQLLASMLRRMSKFPE